MTWGAIYTLHPPEKRGKATAMETMTGIESRRLQTSSPATTVHMAQPVGMVLRTTTVHQRST